MKAVFDTNVLIAAFLTEGVCSKLLRRGRKRQLHLITCPFILQEFEHVLTNKFSATKKETQGALKLVSEAVQTVVHPTAGVDTHGLTPVALKTLILAGVGLYPSFPEILHIAL